jgi:4-amino-4-deoxy-L-arabinose transferase-like glycosyltransferase
MIPLALAFLTGFFVYRHTARKRKTQAVISVLLFALLVVSVYFAVVHCVPHADAHPSTCRRLPCV